MLVLFVQRHLAHLHVLCILLLLPLVVSSFVTDLDNLDQYHGDENIWIPISHDSFRNFFIEHNLSSPFWRDDYFIYGAYNPPIGKYVIGLGTYLAGYRDIPYKPFDWDHAVSWNVAHGYTHDGSIVRAARLPVALLGCLSCVLVYWLGVLVADHWHAFLAVCSLVGGRLLLNEGRRAMLDVPGLCFGLLVLVCMWYLLSTIRAENRPRAVGWAIVVGFVCGLAIGTKMTGLLMPIICVVALLLDWIVCLLKRRDLLIAPLCSLLIMLVAGLVFVASNPFLYPDPVTGVRHMLDLARIVAEAPSAYKTTTLAEKFQALWTYNLFYAPLNQINLPGDRWLLLAGVVGLLVTGWRTPTLFWKRSLGLIVVWIVITYIGIGLWLPNAWDRYTLPVQPCSAFLQAFGVVWLVQIGSKLAKSAKMLRHIDAMQSP